MIFEKHLDLLGIIETRVRNANYEVIANNVFRQWESFANYDSHVLGRIWVGWNPNTLVVTKITESDQVIHCDVMHIESKLKLYLSIIYGLNDQSDRRRLWSNLINASSCFNARPWILMGDFNVIRNIDENHGGVNRRCNAMDDFESCIQAAELMELRYSGIFYTWTNNSHNEACIARKLDRVLVNGNWIQQLE